MIVIPMVGRSSRFFDAGYKRPKYELLLGRYTVFLHAVCSFRQYFESDFFLFLVRRDYGAEEFVRRELGMLGIRRYHIKVFGHDTYGQADTVFQGLQDVDVNESLYIFNIDTFRPGFSKADISKVCDGYIEVFEGKGEHWSFVEPGNNGRVIRTSEKKRISNLCSDGLYFFRERDYFYEAFNYAVANKNTVSGEYYIAPLYNYLIKCGLDIRYIRVDQNEVIFCGTPLEYEALVTMRISYDLFG